MSGHLPAADTLVPVLSERVGRRVLVVHGTADETLPVERGRRIREVLLAAGLNPEYHEFQMGHQITPESLAVVREFVVRVLPPGEAARPDPVS
jgi:phospholipase/carboxylesterase